jgi:hypothetical protein
MVMAVGWADAVGLEWMVSNKDLLERLAERPVDLGMTSEESRTWRESLQTYDFISGKNNGAAMVRKYPLNVDNKDWLHARNDLHPSNSSSSMASMLSLNLSRIEASYLSLPPLIASSIGQIPNPALHHGDLWQSTHRTTELTVVRDTTESELGTRRSRREDFKRGNEPMNAISYPKFMWTKSQTIVVCFLDGDYKQHNFVRKCFGEYDVNLTFKFVGPVEQERSDVRIKFECENLECEKFESLIGTHALGKEAVGQPTMWLGSPTWDKIWLGTADPGDVRKLRANILHEGLHMLGFGHEHSSPNCHIKWKASEVYAHYKSECGWDQDTTDRNVLKRHQAHEVDASEYDPKSIMHYAVDSSLTKDGFCVLLNLELSEMDKKKLRWRYGPKPQMALAAVSPTNLAIAAVLQFRPMDVRFLAMLSFGLYGLSFVDLDAAPLGESYVWLGLLGWVALGVRALQRL